MNVSRRRFARLPQGAFLCGLAVGALTSSPLMAETTDISGLATAYRAKAIWDEPTITYGLGMPPGENARFSDRKPHAIAAVDAWRRAYLARIMQLDPSTLSPGDRATFAVLREQLEADIQLRVCRSELWNVNHINGWQATLPAVAEGQPLSSPKDRADAKTRWSSLPAFVETEINNLTEGLAQGYSAPKSVVARVIVQLDSLLSSSTMPSPLLSPAVRSPDRKFKKAFRQIAARSIMPAISRYRSYLQNRYLPAARTSLAVADLPDGRECYRAMLRANTTLERTPEEVYALGQQTVAANLATIEEIGRRKFGTSDITEILRLVKTDAQNRFATKEQLLTFSRQQLLKAEHKAAFLVTTLPKQEVVVEPERASDEAAGVPSHYDPNSGLGPATYRIQLGAWETQTQGEATIMAVHEAWPGHHLQIALARERRPENQLGDLIANAAYVEGWARYAEGLAEEAGIYSGEDAMILRRIWPARGMVIDPGIHAMGWSRQQAVAYLLSTGRFSEKQADDMVDRIAALPGQLTSYDSGSLEILSLRRQAEKALGPRFEVKNFNETVLEPGVVPLGALRDHVETWIAKHK